MITKKQLLNKKYNSYSFLNEEEEDVEKTSDKNEGETNNGDFAEMMSLLFHSRTQTHTLHLQTESFAEHMALNGFYDGIIDLADSLAETWMGRKEEKIGDIPVINPPKGNPLAVMKRLLTVVQDTRDFCSDDTVLSNIIDEIEALYSSTIYKLKFLK